MSAPILTRPHTKWVRAVGVALGAAVLVGIFVLAFIWPAVTSTVKEFPIAVTGDAAAVSSFEDALHKNAEGRFVITSVDSRADAKDLIETRDVYGAVILGQDPEVLTASAGGTVQTQVMGQLATQAQAQVDAVVKAKVAEGITQLNASVASGQLPAAQAPAAIEKALSATPPTVTVTDVVPLADTDSRGAGFTASAFPMVLGGMIGGIMISLLVTGVWRRFAAIAAYGVVAGLAVTAIMQSWFGILQGDFLLNWAAIGLSMLATGAVIVGATSILGTAGIAVGSVLTMFVGNPISSATQPTQFLPGVWGSIGQFFVPGASVSLLRDISYFTEANPLQSWLVLAGWAVAGIVLSFVGHFRSQEVVHVEGSLETPHTGAHRALATA